jgi:hypothetical protein
MKVFEPERLMFWHPEIFDAEDSFGIYSDAEVMKLTRAEFRISPFGN